MTTHADPSPAMVRAAPQQPGDEASSERLQRWLPGLVLSPAITISALFFYGLTAWVAVVSLTDSGGFVQWNFVGLAQYAKLWDDENWWRALRNLLVYLPVVVAVPMVLGCLLAILLDQKVRFEGGFRTLYLYPLALSWIVSGTIWRWLLGPDTGIEAWLHGLGFEGAVFDWIVQLQRAIYALAVVAVWHGTGFAIKRGNKVIREIGVAAAIPPEGYHHGAPSLYVQFDARQQAFHRRNQCRLDCRAPGRAHPV